MVENGSLRELRKVQFDFERVAVQSADGVLADLKSTLGGLSQDLRDVVVGDAEFLAELL